MTPSEWLQVCLYPGTGSRFLRRVFESTPEESHAFLEGWFTNAYKRSVGRRLNALKTEAEYLPADPFQWISQQESRRTPSKEMKVEIRRFLDYLNAEQEFLWATTEEVFPGADVYPEVRTAPRVMAQLIAKFSDYAKNEGYRGLVKSLTSDQKNDRAFLRETPEKKGRTIEGLKPWLRFNQPVFSHYGFAAKQILAIAVLQGVYKGDESTRVRANFHRCQTPFLSLLKADYSGDYLASLANADRRRGQKFEDLVSRWDPAFRKQMKEVGLTGLRNNARSRDILAYCSLVLAPKVDTHAVFKDF